MIINYCSGKFRVSARLGNCEGKEFCTCCWILWDPKEENEAGMGMSE